MTISVQAQALSLAAGLLLGMGIGLCYDLFRILRCRIPLRGLTAALDLLFWAGVTMVLFLYAQVAEGGQVRLYLALALFSGAALYFHLFSRLALRLGYRTADLLIKISKVLLHPLVLLCRFLKKNIKKAKNIFLSRLQWYKISYTLGKVCRYHRTPGAKEGSKDDQNQKGRHPDKNRRPRFTGLLRHRSAQSQQSDRRRRGGEGRHAGAGRRSDPAQR